MLQSTEARDALHVKATDSDILEFLKAICAPGFKESDLISKKRPYRTAGERVWKKGATTYVVEKMLSGNKSLKKINPTGKPGPKPGLKQRHRASLASAPASASDLAEEHKESGSDEGKASLSLGAMSSVESDDA